MGRIMYGGDVSYAHALLALEQRYAWDCVLQRRFHLIFCNISFSSSLGSIDIYCEEYMEEDEAQDV